MASLALVALIAASGCGSGSRPPTARALALSRQDLVAVSDALALQQTAVAREVAAARNAWRLVANGLAQPLSTQAENAIGAAATGAAAIALTGPLGRAAAASLTGPAALIAGLFRSYALLSARGWTLIKAAAEAIEHGAPAAAAFARQNVALYIESVYDGHFTLAQIGRKLRTGYLELGGAPAFASTLTAARMASLQSSYSEAADRLHPHVGVRLGS